jgi:5-hydroxyisourate hydrolase
MTVSHVTTHVLDAVSGRPAAGIAATLLQQSSAGWEALASAVTDADGRVGEFGPEALDAGVYKVRFETGVFFASRSQDTFYPSIEIVFEVKDRSEHYHVPLLLSPFAYSTYRGS